MTKILLRRTSAAVILFSAVVFAGANSVVLPPDPNYTELHRAAENCDAGKTREALDALPAPQTQEAINLLDREGYTPLAYAARTGCLEVVKLLLQKGASVDAAEAHSGWTPLLWAANQRHADVVRYLLDRGADPNRKTQIGKTPLSVALAGPVFSYGPEGDREATVKALLEKSADPSPLLAAHDELRKVMRAQQEQLEALQNECRRLEAECQHLNETIEKIRNAAGDREPRPL